MTRPYQFDEFFASGLEESVSPFLTPASRKWSKNLGLKSAASAAVCLAFAFISFATYPSLSTLFLSFVYFLVGAPALLAAFDDLKNLEINIDVLMTLAAFTAAAIGSGLEGALLLVLFELSHSMEEMVSQKARNALHNLHDLAPKFAFVFDESGNLYEKSVREISVGARLFIKNGEIVPLDGRVIEGVSSVNLVHLTGESLPVLKEPGDLIPAGARNLESALIVEVERTSSDSTLMRIIRLITEAEKAKPRLQRWLDRFGKSYAAAIIFLTFFFAAALPFFLSIPYLGPEGGIYRALAFLIAASPCALIIATPTAYLSTLSACARKGILLKGGVVLDGLANCQTIAFDKTGTLTTGQLVCTQVDPQGPTAFREEDALSIAASLERQVIHPIARAICQLAADRGCPLVPIEEFQSIPGIGLQAIAQLPIGAVPVSIGALESTANRTPGEILALLQVGSDRFLFRFTDQVRPEAAALLQQLKAKRGLKTVMLTGDHPANAEPIGSALAIDHIFAGLKPEDKLDHVARFSEEGGLAMVGDGINDAPALARATVGISMGRIGSATAVDASDIVLLNDDLHHIDWLLAKSHQTLRIVKQNLTLALGVILFATLPALLGLIPLWTAVLLHEGGTVLVGLNSLRLLYTGSSPKAP